jgi:LacI family transcriptional regulator
MATLKDIAAHAGVSPSTVSRFLNGQITVRDDTRERIEKAVKELGYKANYLARSLVLKETQTIGVVIPDILNPYFSSIARGLEDEAQKNGWSMILCNSDNKVDKELDYLQLLEYKYVDGIILVSTCQRAEQLESFVNRGVNLVLLGRRIQGLGVDMVVVDNVGGAYMAVQHLIGLGHTRIAAISACQTIPTSWERLEGYRQALTEAGHLVDEELVINQGEFQYEDGYSAMEQLLSRHIPSAVFAANDLMAIGAINTIQEHGGTVPDDIAVVGFDGLDVGTWIRPRLTTIAVSPYRLGEMSFRILMNRLSADEELGPQVEKLETQLVIRESCGANRAPRIT